MRKISLGKTGIEISVMGLGTMYFGSKVDERTSFRLMDLYQEHGGNFLDSANKYASWLPGHKGGDSEMLIGRWLKQKGRAADLVIATKVGFPYGDIPRSLKKEIIISECELSLRRLGVECIDLYFAHAYDSDTPVEESMEAFYQLKKAGKIRYVGASNYMAWRLEEANSQAALKDWEGFSCLQQRHTYMEPSIRTAFGNQQVLTPGQVDLCQAREISLMAYSPLLGGIYGKHDVALPIQYQSLLNEQKMASLRALTFKTPFTANQLVLSWMLHSSPQVIPLVTGSNEKQLNENLEAASISLTSEDMDLLDGPVVEPNTY
jgi:aryl-alcohol dehydrogenase-like predicted oxidoreductase